MTSEKQSKQCENIDLRTINGKTKVIGRLLGRMLVSKREALGYTQKDLVKKAKVSMTVLSDIENGRKIPRVETIVKLAQVVEIPLTDIFNQAILPADLSTQRGINSNEKAKCNPESLSSIDEFLLRDGFSKSDINYILDFIEYRRERRTKAN